MAKLKELPEEFKDRIHFQNNISDELFQISIDSEKANFMFQLLNETTDHGSDSCDERAVWFYNKNRICELIEIASDYTYKVSQSIAAVMERLNEATDGLKESAGGGNA